MVETDSTYNEFLRNLHLKSLSVVEFSLKKEKDFHPPAKISISNETEFENTDKSNVKAYIKYSLVATQKDKKDSGLNISIRYEVVYESKMDMTNYIFKSFSQGELLLETWPYFRNFVHEATMLAGLPSLVLDFLKSKKATRSTHKKADTPG
jgi:preprotein translocase subunit SecB